VRLDKIKQEGGKIHDQGAGESDQLMTHVRDRYIKSPGIIVRTVGKHWMEHDTGKG
jgi:hypothetical protein